MNWELMALAGNGIPCYNMTVGGRPARIFVLTALVLSWVAPLCAVAAPGLSHACCCEGGESTPAPAQGDAACCRISAALPTAAVAVPSPASHPVLPSAAAAGPSSAPRGALSSVFAVVVLPQAPPGVFSGLSPPRLT